MNIENIWRTIQIQKNFKFQMEEKLRQERLKIVTWPGIAWLRSLFLYLSHFLSPALETSHWQCVWERRCCVLSVCLFLASFEGRSVALRSVTTYGNAQTLRSESGRCQSDAVAVSRWLEGARCSYAQGMHASEIERNKMAAIISQVPIDGASAGICAQLLGSAASAATVSVAASAAAVAAALAAAACVLAHSQSVNCLARLLSDLG